MSFRKSRVRSRRNSINFVLNTEKWHSYHKRISRRNEFFDESSEENEQTINELKDWVEEFFIRKSSADNKSEQDIEVSLTRKQTLVLSTLVPDEILLMDKYDTTEPKRFVGVLLMADVSGYTALSERYNSLGKCGTYQLTVTLNTYLGSLIEVIYSHGGDIIKFAGDAFLALWKTDKRTYLCHTIHSAIACALIIQHLFGSYETDVKVNLKVKLAIAAGNILFVPIGTGIDMNYIIIGLPVYEAKRAESACGSGQVIVTPTAWGHCYSRNYDYNINDEGFVTIKTILYDPRDTDIAKPFAGFGTMIKHLKVPRISIDNLPNDLGDSRNSISNLLQIDETLNLRKTILTAEEKNIGSEIRKFMIRPVLTQIDAHQPLEYLTEMRHVTVLFITLKPYEYTYPQLITIVNNAYQFICDIVYKSMGCVNKIILFDKDVMVLVIFGLRGFKHESEAQAALKCSYSIKKSISALDGVQEVSIGITTGQVYCGVVGHPLRREFTVIGAIVNKAARLMCGFPNKITCDEATFVKSKMSTNSFTLLPPTTLKGIPQPGKIYEYTEEIRIKELYEIPTIPPILDRNEEIEYFRTWLEDNSTNNRDFDALLIIGESRIGKSRLLEWMSRYVKNKELRVCYVSLSAIHSATPYLALSQIINQILGLKEPINGFAKEEKILQFLKYYNEDLCYLNSIINSRFAYHEGYSKDEDVRKDKAKHIFLKLIMSVTDIYVIFIDDLQHLDVLSWEFISIIMDFTNIFTVLTITRCKFGSEEHWLYKIFNNDKIKKIVLGPLPSKWIAPLACQILDVDAVPYALCNSLRTRCHGMPGLIESFIVHLFSSGAIEVKKIHKEELYLWESEALQFPDTSLLIPMAIDAKDQLNLDKLIQENVKDEIRICIVTKEQELGIDINIQNLDTLIMIQIDSLTPYQQLLLKIASVIGNIVSRDLLENIMYENNPITTAKAIKRLFSMRILSCANVKNISNMKKKVSTETYTSYASICSEISCECSFVYDPETFNYLPKYAFCKVLKFTNSHSRKSCYELLPINQKREFHARIVQYLERNKQKCTNCGGTIMIVQTAMSFHSDLQCAHLNTLSDDDNSDETDKDNEHEVASINMVPSTSFTKDSIVITSSRSEALNKINVHAGITKTTSEVVLNQSSLNCTPSVPQHVPILKKSLDADAIGGRRSTKRVTVSNLVYKDESSHTFIKYKIYDMLRIVLGANKISDWHKLRVIDSKDEIIKEESSSIKESFSVNIEKHVSEINFGMCTCAELNIIIQEQLIYHAIEAELKAKAIELMIKFGFLNILANNFENALPKLEEAQLMCMEKRSIDSLSNIDRKIFLGRIYSLKAASYLMCGKLTQAKQDIERAQSLYRLRFHKVKVFFNFNYILKRKKYLKYIETIKSHTVFCLNIAALIYSTLGEDRKSRKATLRALKLVKKIKCNAIDVCDAFSNALQMEIDRGSSLSTIDIEQLAISSLESYNIQADELFAVGKLYMAFFRARMARGNLPAAIRSGYKALVISRFLHAEGISLDIIPDLFYILLSRCRIKEAISVVKLCLELRKSRAPPVCETWYYALCIDLILDGGFQLESPHDISIFAEYAISRGKSAGASRRRLVVSLWTYWLRAKSDKKAKRFESEALSWCTWEDDDGTLTTLLSAMRLAEGMLESLARKVNNLRKVVNLMELRSLADKELSNIEKDAYALRAVYPRWLLHKANSLSLSGRQSAATSTYNQVIDEAQKVNNVLEEALAVAVTSESKTWNVCARNGQFINWNEGAECAKTAWHKLLYKMTTFPQ